MALSSKFYDYEQFTSIFEERAGVDMSVCDTKGGNLLVCRFADLERGVKIPLYVSPSRKICKILYAMGEDSKVGKGSKTVLDKTVRSSKEFMWNKVKWTTEFLNLCIDKVSASLSKMNAGKLKDFNPHKIVIYGPGDFFVEHMDTTHTPGQNMTAIVELATEFDCTNKNGSLRIGDTWLDSKSDEVNVVVFDHDLPHEVPKIKSGYRVSITFDLVVDPISDQKEDDGKELVDTLLKTGAERIGFFCTHKYLGNQPLKGADARAAKMLGQFAKNTKRLYLSTDDCVKWYHERVWDLKNSGPECGTLMYEVEDGSDEENDHYDAPDGLHKTKPVNEFKADVDELTDLCLNDVLCLWTPYKPQRVLQGDTEVYLGNEGFYGDVHSCTFMLFEF